MHCIQLQYDFQFSACDSSPLPSQVSQGITLLCTVGKYQTDLWLHTQLSCPSRGSFCLPPQAFKHRILVSFSPHFRYLSRPFQTFPFQHFLRNSYAPNPGLPDSSAIDKDQRDDTRIEKEIWQQESEELELHFLFSTSFPGNLSELPVVIISQNTALGVTMAYGVVPPAPPTASSACVWEDATAVTGIWAGTMNATSQQT